MTQAATTDWRSLQEAFTQFSQASATLELSYRELQSESRRLSRELATTNAELERTLDEKENVKNYLKNILQSLSNGVLVADATGKIQVCNPAAAEIFGFDSSNVPPTLGELPLSPQVRDWMRRVLINGVLSDELETQVDTKHAISRYVVISSSSLNKSSEENDGVAFILKDVTRQKELEVKTQRDQKLQAMGEMAVELAHEIRNPLGSIELFASLLAGELRDQERLKHWADQVITSVKFLNTIVTNMLTFTRTSKPQFMETDITAIVYETLDFLNPVFAQRHIRVDRPEPRCLRIDADPQMLRQMLVNLMLNSLQAMPERGRLSVWVRECAEGISIQIEDTGIGIPQENLNRIFDPFFTTNERGTGLGLSIVHQIVERHEGTITASSEFGKGTRFFIVLPHRLAEAS